MGENPDQSHDNTQSQPPAWRVPARQPKYGQPAGQPHPQTPYGQQNPPPGAYGMPPVKQETTNTLAIVSFVSAFLVSLAAIITGHIALGQIKRTGQKGRGLALAGVIIGYVGAVVTGLGLIAVVVATIVAGGAASEGGNTSDTQPVGVPASMNGYGGIVFGVDGKVLLPAVPQGNQDAPTPSQDPANVADIGIKASASGEPAQVVVYLDFLCPHCAAFEAEHGASLQTLRDQGKITLEYRPVGFLDRQSLGTKYSTRSAEAAACVAEDSPESYQGFADSLFAQQPAMNKDSLDNKALAQLAAEAGAGGIEGCLINRDFQRFVGNSTRLATNYGVTGTPTVFVDGQQWKDGSFANFTGKILDAKK